MENIYKLFEYHYNLTYITVINMNVDILIDGKSLDINEFIEKITFEINSALVNSLRDVPEWSKLEIKLEK